MGGPEVHVTLVMTIPRMKRHFPKTTSYRENAPSEDGARRCGCQRKLDNLDEDNHQGKQHQRLDEGEAQNEGELDRRPGSRIARHRLARGAADSALAKSGQPGGNGHAEPGGYGDPIGRRSSGASALRV